MHFYTIPGSITLSMVFKYYHILHQKDIMCYTKLNKMYFYTIPGSITPSTVFKYYHILHQKDIMCYNNVKQNVFLHHSRFNNTVYSV